MSVAFVVDMAEWQRAASAREAAIRSHLDPWIASGHGYAITTNAAPNVRSLTPYAECACGWSWHYPRDMRRKPKPKRRPQ